MKTEEFSRPAAAVPPPALDRMVQFGRGGGHGQYKESLEKAHRMAPTLRRLWFYLRRQRLSLIATALMVCCTVALDVLGPFLLGRAIDRYVIPRDFVGLGWIAVLMLAVYASSAGLTWLQNYLMTAAAQKTVRDVRNDLFAKLQHLPLRFFDQRSHGELMSRLTYDVENFNQVLSGSVTQIVSGMLSTAGIAVVMFCLNPFLSAVSLLTLLFLTLVVNRSLAHRVRKGYRLQQAALGRLNGFVEETVSGQKIVIAYHHEESSIEQFDAANQELRRGSLRAQFFASFSPPLMNAINNLALAIVGGVGGTMVLRGRITVGAIATFISYTRQFGRPLNEIANLYNQFSAALAGAERVFEVIDQEPEVDAFTDRGTSGIEGDVRFEEVTFSYQQNRRALRNVSLHARPGQTIALIGPTGAGKTTLVNLLTRFYEIDHGRILIDGREIREIPKNELRSQLGIVLQENYLFSGTVRENIRYGHLDATDEEVIQAARLANADSFIHRLPQGYDTVLIERGSNLSHGQRQMLAIARAILADPRILILDEATSSVDTRTEKHIQEAMARLMRGRTSFVIAHRLSTIREADQILVVNHGEIVERGTHRELLERQGFYHGLSSHQGALRSQPPEIVGAAGSDFAPGAASPCPS